MSIDGFDGMSTICGFDVSHEIALSTKYALPRSDGSCQACPWVIDPDPTTNIRGPRCSELPGGLGSSEAIATGNGPSRSPGLLSGIPISSVQEKKSAMPNASGLVAM